MLKENEQYQLSVALNFKKEPTMISATNKGLNQAIEQLYVEVADLFLFLEKELQIVQKALDDLQEVKSKLTSGEDISNLLE